jgi:hypothetical protein
MSRLKPKLRLICVAMYISCEHLHIYGAFVADERYSRLRIASSYSHNDVLGFDSGKDTLRRRYPSVDPSIQVAAQAPAAK